MTNIEVTLQLNCPKQNDRVSEMSDTGIIYRAANKDIAERALDDLEDKWGKKYSIVTTSWRNNRG